MHDKCHERLRQPYKSAQRSKSDILRKGAKGSQMFDDWANQYVGPHGPGRCDLTGAPFTKTGAMKAVWDHDHDLAAKICDHEPNTGYCLRCVRGRIGFAVNLAEGIMPRFVAAGLVQRSKAFEDYLANPPAQPEASQVVDEWHKDREASMALYDVAKNGGW